MCKLRQSSKVKNENKGHTYVQWAFAMTVNMSLFQYGMQFGWVSPMTKVLMSAQSPTGRQLTSSEISWIASVVCLTALLTVRLFSTVVDRYGRKTGVMIIAIFQALCWITKCFATSTAALILSRVFCGVPAGACYSIIPLYVREISHDSIRGKLGSLFILFQNTGVLVMYAMGAFLDYYTVLYVVTTVAVLTVVVFWFVLPETPVFLVKLENNELAASTLAKLRGLDANHELVTSELDYIKKYDSEFKSLPTISFLSILSYYIPMEKSSSVQESANLNLIDRLKNKAWRRGFFIIASLVVTQSMSGNFAVLTYAPAILSSSGVTLSPELQTLSFPIFLILGSFVSMNIVERFGRKILLATTFLISVVCMVTLGTVMLLLQRGGSVPGWLPILTIASYSCAYAAGIAPMPYIVMSEMFNFQIRARLMGVLVTMAWCTSFTQLSTFTPISETFGPYSTFYFYTGVNLIGGMVSLLLLPETKGKNVEAIEKELGGK